MKPSPKTKLEKSQRCANCVQVDGKCKPSNDPSQAPCCRRCLKMHLRCSLDKRQALSRDKWSPRSIPIHINDNSQLTSMPEHRLHELYQLETLMRLRNCVRKRLQQWPSLFCNGDLNRYRPFKLLSRSITSLELRASQLAGNKMLVSNPQSAPTSPPTSSSVSPSALTLALTHYTRFYQVAGTRYRKRLLIMIREALSHGELAFAVKLLEKLIDALCSPRPTDPDIMAWTEEQRLRKARAALSMYNIAHNTIHDVNGRYQKPRLVLLLPPLEHSLLLLKVAVACDFFHNSVDALGRSLLHLILGNGSALAMEIDVSALIARSVMADHVDNLGMAPIHLACLNGNAKAVIALVQRRVLLDIPVGDDDWLPLHCAVVSGDTATSGALLGGLQANQHDLNCRTTKGQTALHLAIEYGHVDLVQDLVARGVDPAQHDDKGHNALHQAVLSGQVDAVQYLLEYDGYALNIPVHQSQSTPLHLACSHPIEHREDILEVLLEHNSTRKNAKDDKGQTSLHLAVKLNLLDVVKVLCYGARVYIDDVNGNGETALFVAAKDGNDPIVSHLVDTGMAGLYENKEDETPLSIARKLGHDQVVQTLVSLFGEQDDQPRSETSAESDANMDTFEKLFHENDEAYAASDDNPDTIAKFSREDDEVSTELGNDLETNAKLKRESYKASAELGDDSETIATLTNEDDKTTGGGQAVADTSDNDGSDVVYLHATKKHEASDVNSSDVNSSDVNSSDVNSSDVNASDDNPLDDDDSDVVFLHAVKKRGAATKPRAVKKRKLAEDDDSDVVFSYAVKKRGAATKPRAVKKRKLAVDDDSDVVFTHAVKKRGAASKPRAVKKRKLAVDDASDVVLSHAAKKHGAARKQGAAKKYQHVRKREVSVDEDSDVEFLYAVTKPDVPVLSGEEDMEGII